MGQTGAGENGQFLSAHQRVESVDGGYAGLNELVGIVPGGRIHGQTVDIHELFRQQLRAAVDRLTHAVEYAAQHIAGHAHLQRMTEKTDLTVAQVDAGGAVKKLYHGAVAVHLQHLAKPHGTVGQPDLRQLVVGNALHLLDHHQGAGDLVNGAIFLDHDCSPAFLASASISSAIVRAISSYARAYWSDSVYFAQPSRSREGMAYRSVSAAPLAIAPRQRFS